jgi:2-keto-4-pentenoate hydratase/2-oxohepta-3-ene-1,7-dioic acid hydratase in catechol pathway
VKLVTYRSGPAERLGALIGEGQILDLAQACEGPAFASMQALIEAGEDAWDKARTAIARPLAAALLPRSAVRLLAPLPRPIRLRDCSLFLQHMEAALDRHVRNLAAAEPDPEAAYQRITASGDWAMNPLFKRQAIYYNADHLAVSGPEDEIVWPVYSDWMDYELEWACVVGRTARDISPGDARAHIFGYTIFNDWSARDIQLPIMETKLGPGEGKDFDLGNTLGPCIATPDEFPDPYALTMTAKVNGEEWSRGSTGTMHHSFEDAVVQFSRDKVLHAGEVIGSGTVLTGCGFELGRKLQDGDLVELEVEGIGALRNRVLRSAQSLKKSA